MIQKRFIRFFSLTAIRAYARPPRGRRIGAGRFSLLIIIFCSRLIGLMPGLRQGGAAAPVAFRS